MKIKTYGEAQVIMSNPGGKHNYFGWPTATRLQNGKIAVVASGFRLRHVCPFGKTVISYSEDEGKTYTLPAPVIDTVLDDRDGGIMTFGESGVIVTSFNNAVEFQRKIAGEEPYRNAYLDTVTEQEEKAAVGSTFRISNDCGATFGPIHKSPVTTPHGPIELNDGTILYVGRKFTDKNAQTADDCIMAYTINPQDGSMTYLSTIENVLPELKPLSCEPHAIELDNGRILCHIRVEKKGDDRRFTIFQCESDDKGKTWTTPHQIIGDTAGAPAHLFKHSSGMLISTYGYRTAPFGIRAMFSQDGGKTWDADNDVYVNNVSWDIGYPSTVELEDGSMLTVFYAHRSENEPAIIMQQKWSFEK